MTLDLIDLLDRQFKFLLRQEGSTFLRELRRTFEVLQREPRLAALLDDERRSAMRLIDRFEEHEQRFTQEFVALRHELVRLAPDLDDSGTPSPPDDAWPDERHRWSRTLAAFDAISWGSRSLGQSNTERDTSRTRALINTLYHKLEDARWVTTASGEPRPTKEDQRPELEPIEQIRQQLRENHTAVWRPFYDSLLTAPGAHLLYIEDLLSQMSRGRSSLATRTPQLALIIESLKLPSQYSFTSLLYERIDHEKKAAADAEEEIAKLRPVVERIYEGLRLRIGTTRSLIALFNRFRTRCQFHDRERLRDLAKHPPGSVAGRARQNRRNKPEQILTEALARYLFDQGLNPLTEVPTAGLRPDVLDPGYLYVEAKQYGSGNPRNYLIKGARQVHETMGRLRGSHYQVHEAFYVVFRLGGRHISLPDRIPCGEWTLYPVFIDLAPASESGSRARESLIITEEELRPHATSSLV